ncbi:MAG: hypothetical protein ABII88_05935 [Candidatus Omnitrophota bacterium]
MNNDIPRDLGEQPIARIMQERNLKPNDLVRVSPEQMTHKMVSRACKGRRLTSNVKVKILKALNLACESTYAMKDIFNY